MEESEENITSPIAENYEEKDDKESHHSKGNLIEPDTKSDNMKDLKPLDLNSADDVRQTLKAVFTSKIPNFIEHSEDYIGLNNNCGNDLLRDNTQKVNEIDDCILKNDKNHNILQTKRSKELRSLKKRDTRKRRGRPPKTGPSKTIKKQKIATMYIGKLSNIVFLKRGNESDSDIDSN